MHILRTTTRYFLVPFLFNYMHVFATITITPEERVGFEDLGRNVILSGSHKFSTSSRTQLLLPNNKITTLQSPANPFSQYFESHGAFEHISFLDDTLVSRETPSIPTSSHTALEVGLEEVLPIPPEAAKDATMSLSIDSHKLRTSSADPPKVAPNAIESVEHLRCHGAHHPNEGSNTCLNNEKSEEESDGIIQKASPGTLEIIQPQDKLEEESIHRIYAKSISSKNVNTEEINETSALSVKFEESAELLSTDYNSTGEKQKPGGILFGPSLFSLFSVGGRLFRRGALFRLF